MITDKQRAARNKGIGSSEVATLFGLNKWATPHDLWLMKTGRVEPEPENDAMRIGSLLEVPLLQLAGQKLNRKIVRPPFTFTGGKPHFRANIDGMIGEARRGSDIVEIKTTGITDGWGSEGTDEVPDTVRMQVQYQMACSSSTVAHIGVLTGSFGLNFKMYRLEYESEYCEFLLARVDEWWQKHIEQDQPPSAPASIEVLKRIARTQDTVQLPLELFEAEAAAKRALAKAEVEYEHRKAALVTALGTAQKGTAGPYSVAVTEVQSDKFDRKALEAEHPDLAALYVVPSGYKRIDIRCKKGT